VEEDAPLRQQQHAVERGEHLRGGCLQGRDKRPAALTRPAHEEAHHVERHRGVQAVRDLVRREDAGAGQKRLADGHAPLLAAADAARHGVANDGVLALCEAQQLNHAVDARRVLADRRRGGARGQRRGAGGVGKREELADGQEGLVLVLLRRIRRQAPQVHARRGLELRLRHAVVTDAVAALGAVQPPRQSAQQRALAAARAADNEGGGACRERRGDTAQEREVHGVRGAARKQEGLESVRHVLDDVADGVVAGAGSLRQRQCVDRHLQVMSAAAHGAEWQRVESRR
jgi:hypothetical protein